MGWNEGVFILFLERLCCVTVWRLVWGVELGYPLEFGFSRYIHECKWGDKQMGSLLHVVQLHLHVPWRWTLVSHSINPTFSCAH
jgi:hypothetical protein